MSPVLTLAGGGHHLLLALPDAGMPAILAWGPAPPGGTTDAALPLGLTALRVNGMDDPIPEATLLPTGGLGRFGWPALAGHRDGRDWTAAFGTWRAEPGPGTLALRGRDAVARLALSIRLAVSDAGVWTMAVTLVNEGEDAFTLDRCMAGTVLVGADTDTAYAFSGGWGREFQLAAQGLTDALWLQESRRGRTSHDRSPTVFVGGSPAAFGDATPAAGLHLGWSGNHVVAIERLEDGRRLLHAGELFEPGEMRLPPGAAYESPVAFFAAGDTIEAVGSAFRAHLRRHVLAWPAGAPGERPVTLNTWEGTAFKHDIANLKAQATAAAALGVERFVLDDGWFGRRDDDDAALGDWWVDPRKYPDGLGPLVRHVTGLGMQFGLWVEPEMVNPDSDLYRAHPDWALAVPGRPRLTSRDQLVLDLTRPEAADHVFRAIDTLLRDHAIAYLKWDMNRDLAPAGGADGRAVTSRQTRAVYALMDRLRAAHPHLEIESCASGGGRVDYGVLARTQRVWLSDCTDALDRLAIQAGGSLLLPPEIVGAHVSAVPNHQTGRRHSLAFRAVVALAFHFGIELDPLKLTAAERDEVAGWIALHKRLRPLLHGEGTALFRHPVDDGRHVWGARGADRIVLFVAQAGQMRRYRPGAVRIAGADPALTWRVAGRHPAAAPFVRTTAAQAAVLAGTVPFAAGDLAAVGLPVPPLTPESAVILELEGRSLPMADVQLRAVTKSFGEVEIIKGVDLDVGDGEFCVFVGPSGCGKSTLLRLVAGLEEITSGTLAIGGRPMTRVPPANRGVAMVFQSYALYPHMSVAENITFGLRMAGAEKSEVERRLGKAAAMLQLGPYLDRKPSQLSGGQRQRVAIGRAVVREPEVFLFDEPLSNLDAALRVATRIEIGKLHQELGATMIYVTHDQVEAMTMADKIVVLSAGHIEQVGSPLELYHRPKSRFVAGFIGSPKMNFLDVPARGTERGAVATLPGGAELLLPGAGALRGPTVTLGVRPEHLLLGGGGDASVQAVVRLAEHLGAETMLYAEVPGPAEIVVRADGLTRIKPGETVAVGVAAASCHLFGPGGEVIRNGSLL